MSKFISGTYKRSTILKIQGNRKKISEYLKVGYKIKTESNGFWILYKPTIMEMVFQEKDKTYVFDMKSEACEYLNKNRISKKTANVFIQAVKNGDIIIQICPETGTYTLKQNR